MTKLQIAKSMLNPSTLNLVTPRLNTVRKSAIVNAYQIYLNVSHTKGRKAFMEAMTSATYWK